MEPLTLEDIAAAEAGLITTKRANIGGHVIADENALHEALGVPDVGKHLQDDVAVLPGLTEAKPNGHSGASPARSRDNSGILKKFKKGDRIKIEAPWLRKGRIVTVTADAKTVGSTVYLYVSSGEVRPTSRKGGSVAYNLWGKGELTYQPTLLQQTQEITRVSKATNEDALGSEALDALTENEIQPAKVPLGEKVYDRPLPWAQEVANRLERALKKSGSLTEYSVTQAGNAGAYITGKLDGKNFEVEVRAKSKYPRPGSPQYVSALRVNGEWMRGSSAKTAAEMITAEGALPDDEIDDLVEEIVCGLTESIDADMERAFKEFMRFAQGLIDTRYKQNLDLKPELQFSKGKKWWRLFFYYKGAQGRTAYGFFDPSNGNLLKSEGWKKPALNFPRGNVLDKSTWNRNWQYAIG